jgi:hypothetical protein
MGGLVGWSARGALQTREEGTMKRLTLAGGVLALLLASGTAWAGSDSGLYIGGSVGSAGFDPSGGADLDDATGYKVFGGYNFGIVPLVDVAIEGSYVNFGTAEGNNLEAKASGLDAFGLVGLSMGPVSLFGKVGAIYWDGEFSSPLGSTDDSGTDPAYGIGLQFQLLSIAVRAEYEMFALDDVDIGFVSLGASYTF